DYGSQMQLIDDKTRVNLLGNKLVLIAGKDSKLNKVTIDPSLDLASLAGEGRIATGDVRAVPVGIYAKAALQELGLWGQSSRNLPWSAMSAPHLSWLRATRRRSASSTPPTPKWSQR